MGAAVELNFNIPLLNFTNWFTWKTDVKVCLLHHGAWQYIESSDVVDEKPTAETSKETTDVNLRKIRAYTIIYQHVSPELRPLISATTDGKIAWNILHEHFEPSTRARVIQLLDEFFAIRHQPGMDLGLFLCHIKNAAARLREAGHELPSLYFGYQMIRSLPVEYQPIVQTIYRWSDKEFTPDKIEQELLLEQNRLMQVEKDLSTETVFFSKQNKYKTGKTFKQLNVSENVKVSKQSCEAKGSKNIKQIGPCFRCKSFGHLIANCKNKVKRGGKNSEARNTEFLANSVFADSEFCLAETSCETNALGINSENSSWVFDTAATTHFCNNLNLFSDFKPVSDIKMSLAVAKGECPVEGVGTIQFLVRNKKSYNKIIITNVLYNPNLRRNLLSGVRFDKSGAHFVCSKGKIQVYDRLERSFLCYSKLCLSQSQARL